MKYIHHILLCVILILILTLSLTSCQKEFLDKKPNKALLVPTTLSDFQALLDNSNTMNYAPGMNIIASDDLDNTADGLDQVELPLEKNAFLWAADIYEGLPITPDWDTPYQQIFYANVVLNGLQDLEQTSSQAKQLKGSALFYRSFALYQLLQLFAKPYAPATAATDPGVPVPVTANVSNRPGRGTVAAAYRQLIADLQTAATLLPQVNGLPTRPTQASAYGLLARTYLTMQEYEQAANAANECLKLNDRLLDYNDLDASSGGSLPVGIMGSNPEILFYAFNLYSCYFLPSTVVEAELANSYTTNDLRKTLLIEQNGADRNFKGSYTGDLFSYGMFAGLATDELYLTRAEAFARTNRIADALKDLNLLRSRRYQSGTINPVTVTDPEQVLRLILTERRKELLTRGTRWTDLRRLNQDSRFAVTLKRDIDVTEYTLLPHSLRYLFPIPDNEINISGITQNPR
ncbi:RagB/SusD family nutrient uptake outer membrane protein [Mucilaginibacter myungsuensis]|uniref:RagB/SusD family nutrient uptake outer membrane protein n=1 Tax=Mucilaginibacter myungsuensis TaxID=649104 RepID=A0A929PY93_9SPHI|nr:RagB/SusD family nutrient uptake outer membrane protein [Mucilaginibacter myungsuensis]MBE9663097.1 RagB/SusD family nutrient uptake outer membrane protein [Mucilaginibacter myungsuensis]MDN3598732.1 RagB/SusD family nutrient uptake outer membrane protein [Mucilaginibacter myungsuensis]